MIALRFGQDSMGKKANHSLYWKQLVLLAGIILTYQQNEWHQDIQCFSVLWKLYDWKFQFDCRFCQVVSHTELETRIWQDDHSCRSIYPFYSYFVKRMKYHIIPGEQRSNRWQESPQKDVKRLVGILKGTWKFTGYMKYIQNLNKHSMRM